MSANPYVFIPSFSAGVPWTEDEHRLFLLGLQKLGKVSSGGYIYFRTESFRRHPAFFIRAARARRGVVERRATEHCGHRAYFGPFPHRGVPSGRSRRWKTSSDASVPSFFAHDRWHPTRPSMGIDAPPSTLRIIFARDFHTLIHYTLDPRRSLPRPRPFDSSIRRATGAASPATSCSRARPRRWRRTRRSTSSARTT